MSGVLGGAMGVAFGAFMQTMNMSSGRPEDFPEGTPLRQQTRVILRQIRNSMKSSSRNFAMFGMAYATMELMVETVRAKHDLTNPALAGCATGAGLALSGGPPAMGLGCVSCAAMCVAMDYFFLRD
jgi:import inner membrane translocase subunit TIM22